MAWLASAGTGAARGSLVAGAARPAAAGWLVSAAMPVAGACACAMEMVPKIAAAAIVRWKVPIIKSCLNLVKVGNKLRRLSASGKRIALRDGSSGLPVGEIEGKTFFGDFGENSQGQVFVSRFKSTGYDFYGRENS